MTRPYCRGPWLSEPVAESPVLEPTDFRVKVANAVSKVAETRRKVAESLEDVGDISVPAAHEPQPVREAAGGVLDIRDVGHPLSVAPLTGTPS